MSPKATTKHAPAKHSAKHNVPIVNVFDEDQAQNPVQPARRPVVVEIEDVPTQTLQSPVAPPMPQQQPTTPTITSPFAPEIPAQQPVWQQPAQQVSAMPQETYQVPQAPMSAAMPEVSNLQTPEFTQPPVAMNNPGMNAEPMLPSFFEHDLKNGMGAQPQQAMPALAPQPAPTMFTDASATMPQGVVGEINEVAEAGEGGSNKKVIGIVLMVLAVLILAIGGLFLYARNLFSPTSVPTPTPEVVATPRPTPDEMTPPPASSSATLSASESAALKKKVKVDVLNGTKTAGLATKEAAVIKAAGFTTGTVGNGKPEAAGTIVVSPTYKGLVSEIQTALKDFTFTVTEDAKATSIVVTLGASK